MQAKSTQVVGVPTFVSGDGLTVSNKGQSPIGIGAAAEVLQMPKLDEERGSVAPDTGATNVPPLTQTEPMTEAESARLDELRRSL
jgi:hypothetical protein